MLCLFVREVSLDLLLVLWDFYAAHPQGLRHAFSVMHVYVCAAFMLRFRNDILRLEFPGILQNLQFRIYHSEIQNLLFSNLFDDILITTHNSYTSLTKYIYNIFCFIFDLKLEMLKFLHNPPTKEWTTQDMYDLIAHATALYNSYPLP